MLRKILYGTTKEDGIYGELDTTLNNTYGEPNSSKFIRTQNLRNGPGSVI